MAASGASPLDALTALVEAGELGRAAQAGAREFLDTLAMLRDSQHEPVEQLMARLLERTRYLEHLEAAEDASDRKANVQELVASAEGFSNTGGTLAEFLGEAALVTDMDRLVEDADRVLLLTAHNAQGLAFPHVSVAGVEDG